MTTEHSTTPPLADDRTLVTRFVRRRDETAFAELVRRHGGLVHGVCRRVLRNSHDVEDAFQATFLVLARDAHRIVKRRSLVSWLHGVAYRTSLRAAESRHRRIRLLQDVTMIEDSTLADVELRHERQKLDEELAGLPEKYRTPLVLHYLEGKSNVEIAKLLGLSVSNIEGRLKRGRKELKLRLTRCGIGLSAALAAVQWSQSLTAATPLETLVGPAIEAGLSYTAGDPAGPLFTHEAARLAGQEMIRMSALTTTAATLSVLVLVPMAALLSGHDGDPTLPPGGGAVAVTTILAALPEDQPIDESSEAVVTPPVDNSQLPQVSFFTRNGKVYRQTVEELGEVSDSDIISFTGDTGFDVQVRDNSAAGGASAPGDNTTPTAGPASSATLPPERFDYRTASPAAERIEEALDEPTSFEFVDTPLHDAVQYVAQLHKITILIDEVALNDIGVPTDEPVNLVLTGVSLRSALDIMLSPFDLDTLIEDEVMKVTSKERAEERLEARVYSLARLAHIPPETLVQILETSIPGATWITIDGAGGTASPFSGGLVVKQDQRTHHQIVELLELLARQAAATEARAPRTSSAPGSTIPTDTPGATAGLPSSAPRDKGISTAEPASSDTPPAATQLATVSGTVTLDGQPAKKVTVRFRTLGPPASGVTGDDGRYSLQMDGKFSVPAGACRVFIGNELDGGTTIPARYSGIPDRDSGTSHSMLVTVKPGHNVLNFDLTSGVSSSTGAKSNTSPGATAFRPALAQVEGTVTIDGQPVTGVQVEFVIQGVAVAGARTDDAGRYRLRSQEMSGCPTGDFEVRVSGQTAAGQAIPARYNSETKLRAKVLPGKNDLDIGLTSEDDSSRPSALDPTAPAASAGQNSAAGFISSLIPASPVIADATEAELYARMRAKAMTAVFNAEQLRRLDVVGASRFLTETRADIAASGLLSDLAKPLLAALSNASQSLKNSTVRDTSRLTPEQ